MSRFSRYLLIFIFLSFVECPAIDYRTANTSSEILELETIAINDARLGNPHILIESLLDRAESYLILGGYRLAFEDYAEAHSLCSFMEQDQQIAVQMLRILFGSAITAFNLGLEEKGWEIFGHIAEAVDAYKCPDCSCYPEYEIVLAADPHQPILGPESIPVRDCIERAGTTSLALKALLVKARPEVQFLLNQTIDLLYGQAVGCCKAGGLWKGCLQKLVNKLHQWNVFGIPADPAWD